MKTANLSSLKEKLDRAPGALVVTDPKGRIVYTNERVSRITGFTLPEIIGNYPGRLWGGQMPQRFYRTMWEMISVRHQPFVGRVHNKRKNGEGYQDDLAIFPVIDRERAPRWYLALKPVADFGSLLEDFRMLGSSTKKIAPRNLIERLFRSLGIQGEEKRSIISRFSLSRFIEEGLATPLQEQFATRSLDHALVRAARHEPETFHALYEKYHPTVLHYFLRHLSGDRALAEDLTQDTFLRAFRHLPRFREENASYGTYLLRIAHNLLVNQYRREKTLSVTLDEGYMEAVERAADHSPLFDQSLGWLSEEKTLRPIEREVLTQFYHRGHTIREIARMLGKSENAIKLTLSRSRQKLRRALGL